MNDPKEPEAIVVSAGHSALDALEANLEKVTHEGISRWVLRRQELARRERHLLEALAKQLADAGAQKTPEKRDRYLGQCVHIRSQILELRGEENTLTIETK